MKTDQEYLDELREIYRKDLLRGEDPLELVWIELRKREDKLDERIKELEAK